MAIDNNSSLPEIINAFQNLLVISGLDNMINAVGSPASQVSTADDLASMINNSKQSLVTALATRGITANTSDSLSSLVSKCSKNNNLIASNIKNGVTIDGVTGNIKPVTYGMMTKKVASYGQYDGSRTIMYPIPGGDYYFYTQNTGSGWSGKTMIGSTNYSFGDISSYSKQAAPIPLRSSWNRCIIYYKSGVMFAYVDSKISKYQGQSNGWDYDLINSYPITPTGYTPIQMLPTNNQWVILFRNDTTTTNYLIHIYDQALTTKVKELTLTNFKNPVIGYNYFFDIYYGRVYDYNNTLLKTTGITYPYDDFVNFNDGFAAIGANDYEINIRDHMGPSNGRPWGIYSVLSPL